MTNLGSFTFKNGFLIVKSPVLNLENFARDFNLGKVVGNKISMPDLKYTEVRDALLQAGYTYK